MLHETHHHADYCRYIYHILHAGETGISVQLGTHGMVGSRQTCTRGNSFFLMFNIITVSSRKENKTTVVTTNKYFMTWVQNSAFYNKTR